MIMDGFQYQPLLNSKGYSLNIYWSISEWAFFPSRRSAAWIHVMYSHNRMQHCYVLISSKVVPCQYIWLRDFTFHLSRPINLKIYSPLTFCFGNLVPGQENEHWHFVYSWFSAFICKCWSSGIYYLVLRLCLFLYL